MKYERTIIFLFVTTISIFGIMTIFNFGKKYLEVTERNTLAINDSLQILKGYNSDNTKTTAYEKVKGLTSEIEKQINKNMFGRVTLVEIYGGLQKAIGKRIIETDSPDKYLIKLNNGQYAFYEPHIHSSNSSKKIEELKYVSEKSNSRFTFILRPTKIMHGTLPYNIYDTEYFLTEEFIDSISQYGTEILDLRKYMPENPESYKNKFFVTDHHWKITTAFSMAKIIAGYLGFDTSAYKDDLWFIEKAERCFYGSLAENTGATFFQNPDTVYIPVTRNGNIFKLERYSYKFPSKIVTGTFAETMIDKSYLQDKDKYAHRYAACLGGDSPFIRITNKNCKQKHKILVFGDSFSLSLIMYLSPAVSVIDYIDLRSYAENNIKELISNNAYDNVVCIYPNDLNGDLFEFFK